MANNSPDARFDRAVAIVHSLPKGGAIQTSYEEKLHLYSLYKQSTDGDIATPRPGLLDMLGRAKWDSWNKQKGKRREDAKGEYVAALLKILKKHPNDHLSQETSRELEGNLAGSSIVRAASPSSSTTSSYHSSQAPSPPPSPPPPQPTHTYPFPDPSEPAPDVSPDIIPPSALNASHKSLLSLQEHQAGPSDYAQSAPAFPPPLGSRTHSLVGRPGGSSDTGFHPARNPSIHSFRRPHPQGVPTGLGYVSDTQSRGARSPNVVGRDFTMTPEIPMPSPYAGIHQPTPIYPRPGSASTFATIPPVNVPATLQQIQLSLTALHERLSTLERTQAILVRREERKRGWFWGSSEEDELDQLEEDAERDRWIGRINTRTGVRIRRGMPARLVWWLITAVRRAMIDVGLGLAVVAIGMVVLSGGYRRGRGLVERWKERLRDFLRNL